MGVGSFFKLPKYSVFNYQPLYYDPEKERREARRKELRIERGKDIDIDSELSTEERIRGRMRYRIPPVKRAKRNSNYRLLGILSFLLLLVWLLTII